MKFLWLTRVEYYLPAMQETQQEPLVQFPRWERSPREGRGNSFQYSCLAGYSPRGRRELDTIEQLNNNNHHKSRVNFLQL